MRVDGVPNVMTCRKPVREGMKIETQNVVGSVTFDLLSITDWAFPKGLDHHHMWTRFKPTNDLMKKIARRVAGVGTLPDEALPPQPIETLCVDVLVVGAGYAGIAAANEAARRGASVLLVDEARARGGEARLLSAAGLEDEDEEQIRLGPPVAYRRKTTALGVYRERPNGAPLAGGIVLVHNDEGLCAVECDALIVASGVTGGAVAFPGNDLPGVITATGALVLLSSDVKPERVGLVGDGPLLSALGGRLRDLGVHCYGPFGGAEVEAHGKNQVETLRVGTTSHRVDWVVAGAPPSAAGELAVQGGATMTWSDGGFFVDAGDDGSTQSPFIFAIGSCTNRRGQAALEQALAAARLATRSA
ncbi:MAG: sarcosine oxidase subunit alpha [Polyangiales bacterium]|jgi:sarcosine oxidase subunit alpha